MLSINIDVVFYLTCDVCQKEYRENNEDRLDYSMGFDIPEGWKIERLPKDETYIEKGIEVTGALSTGGYELYAVCPDCKVNELAEMDEIQQFDPDDWEEWLELEESEPTA